MSTYIKSTAASTSEVRLRVNTERLTCPIHWYSDLIKSPYLKKLLEEHGLYGELNFKYRDITSYLTINPHNLAYRIVDLTMAANGDLYMTIERLETCTSNELFQQNLVNSDMMYFIPRILYCEASIDRTRLITVDGRLKDDIGFSCTVVPAGQ